MKSKAIRAMGMGYWRTASSTNSGPFDMVLSGIAIGLAQYATLLGDAIDALIDDPASCGVFLIRRLSAFGRKQTLTDPFEASNSVIRQFRAAD